MTTSYLEEAALVPLAVTKGETVPVALFAGGTTGLVLGIGRAEPDARCSLLAERAEEWGFSALLAAAPSERPEETARAAARRLRELGVRRSILVAAEREAEWALSAAAGGFEALVLLSPVGAAANWAGLRGATMPKLIVLGSGDDESSRTTRTLYRSAVGLTLVRSFPVAERGSALVDCELGDHVVETVLTFAARSCGLDTPPPSTPVP